MRTTKKKVAKYDAKQIGSGALEVEGKFIAAQIKTMRQYEAKANELAGVELRKAEDNRTTVEKRLADVHAKCRGDGFKVFKAKYAPDFGRTKLYEILRIAAGKTTREEIRSNTAERVRKHRSLQANVTDASTTSATDDLAQPVNDNLTGEVSTEDRKAEMARLAGETPAETPPTPEPTPEPVAEPTAEQPPRTLTPEEISDEALATFKKVVPELWAKMLKPELEHVRKWTSEQTVKLENKLLKLAKAA